MQYEQIMKNRPFALTEQNQVLKLVLHRSVIFKTVFIITKWLYNIKTIRTPAAGVIACPKTAGVSLVLPKDSGARAVANGVAAKG